MNKSSAHDQPKAPVQSLPQGILFVDKPKGITSHTVVSRVRRALGLKKVGHAGTLDPMATGLVLIGVGSHTRFLTWLVGLDKEYYATIRLGGSSTTDDADGDIHYLDHSRTAAEQGITLSDFLQFTESTVADTVATFVGDIEQVPSSVSAIKVDGRRAYDRVRSGEIVKLPSRAVTIYEYDVLGVDNVSVETVSVENAGTDNVNVVDVSVRVRCSSGTYIRALARDLGRKLGTEGFLTALRRTAVGPISVDDAISVEDVAVEYLKDSGFLAKQLFRSRELDETEVTQTRHGIPLELSGQDIAEIHDQIIKYSGERKAAGSAEALDNPVALLAGTELIALSEFRGNKLKPVTVFVSPSAPSEQPR